MLSRSPETTELTPKRHKLWHNLAKAIWRLPLLPYLGSVRHACCMAYTYMHKHNHFHLHWLIGLSRQRSKPLKVPRAYILFARTPLIVFTNVNNSHSENIQHQEGKLDTLHEQSMSRVVAWWKSDSQTQLSKSDIPVI